jgi:hypothetical protein
MRYNTYMNTQTATYQVSGNWDQISRYFGLRSLAWKVRNPWFPNRVYIDCEDLAAAKFIYKMLTESKLVAAKNWLE